MANALKEREVINAFEFQGVMDGKDFDTIDREQAEHLAKLEAEKKRKIEEKQAEEAKGVKIKSTPEDDTGSEWWNRMDVNKGPQDATPAPEQYVRAEEPSDAPKQSADEPPIGLPSDKDEK